jgi:hypothetical protein
MKKKTPKTFVFLLFCFVFIGLVSLPSVDIAGENWLSGWQYRKPYVLSQTASSANNIVEISNSHFNVEKISFQGYSGVYPVFLSNKRFLVLCKGWGDNQGVVEVWNATSTWQKDIMLRNLTLACDTYAIAFQNIWRNAFIIMGKLNHTFAYFGLYNITTNNFKYQVTNSCVYITDIHYCASNGYLYIAPGVVNSSQPWYNKILTVKPENVLNLNVWKSILLPNFGLSPSGYEEIRMTYYRGNFYLHEQDCMYWKEYKYNPITGVFTLLFSSNSTNRSNHTGYFRNTKYGLAVTQPFSTPSRHFDLLYTNEDNPTPDDFLKVVEICAVTGGYGEQHCFAAPYDENTLWVQNSNDGSSDGFVATYHVNGTLIQQTSGINTPFGPVYNPCYDTDSESWAWGCNNDPKLSSANLLLFNVNYVGSSICLQGKAEADFSDIRFTSDDCYTMLAYQLVSVSGNIANFKVTAPSAITTREITIYIYYGKLNDTTPIFYP